MCITLRMAIFKVFKIFAIKGDLNQIKRQDESKCTGYEYNSHSFKVKLFSERGYKGRNS